MFRIDLKQLEELSVVAYFRLISSKFCPFISPAENAGSLFFSSYDLTGDPERWNRSIFALAVIHTEILRRERARACPRGAALFCENLFFEPQPGIVQNLETHLGWPHWVLKLLYLDLGVLYGKFWKGEKTKDRRNLDIPEPPVNFLSIRSAIKRKDARFLNGRKELQEILLASEDSGVCCFQKVPLSDHSRAAVATLHETLRIAPYSEAKIMELAKLLEVTNLFDECKEWATTFSNSQVAKVA